LTESVLLSLHVHRTFNGHFLQLTGELCLGVTNVGIIRHFRVLCHSFRKVIDSRFPEHSNLFLAGFMFLRYVCAALLSPDDFGIHPCALHDNFMPLG
jgi:hypothetical protein